MKGMSDRPGSTPRWTRRAALTAGGAAALSPAWAALGQHADLSGARLFADVERYVAMGEHRTATPANWEASRWLAARLRRAGWNASLPTYPFQLFDLTQRRLTVDGRDVTGFPLWRPAVTPSRGIAGPLTIADPTESTPLHGKVALVEFPAPIVGRDSRHAAIIRAAADRGALAVVGWQPRRGENFLTWNVETPHHMRPWPLPVMTVARRDLPALREAAARGATAQVLVRGRVRQTRAPNVLATLGGGGPAIVVSTPLSGWLRNGGERGPGVALWMALAEAVARRRPSVRYIFTAHSGHEIGHLGQDHFLETVRPEPRSTRAWLHLGSGIATRREPRAGRTESAGLQNAVASPELNRLIGPIFERLTGAEVRTEDPGGELADIMAAGFPSFGIFGGNAFTHAADDGADQTSPERLQTVAIALDAALQRLESGV